MPSPVAHSLMGYIIYRAVAQPVGLKRWQLLGLCLLSVNVPDLDFIPGFLVGDPTRYHRGISHSLGFAVLYGVLCTIWLALTKRAEVWRTFLFFFALYASHLILDWLSINPYARYGVPLFWPFSDTPHIAPFAFWLNIQRATSSGAFLPSLLTLHNLWAVTVECLVLFPAILLVRALKNPATHRSWPLTKGELHNAAEPVDPEP